MSRYESYIETGLGTKERFFKGVFRLYVTLHVLESARFAIFDRTLTDRMIISEMNHYSLPLDISQASLCKLEMILHQFLPRKTSVPTP